MAESYQLSEVFDHFIKPQTQHWRVLLPDGKVQDFDPVTLINSLIESEVPLDHAFRIFDAFLPEAQTRFSDHEMTQREIHALVSQVLLTYQHHNRTIWFRNYSNIFGPEIAVAHSDSEVFFVRSASGLRRFIKEFLESEFSVITSKRRESTISRVVPKEQLDRIVERFIKLVRVCGFYRLSIDFLQGFIRELAYHSNNRILPQPGLERERLRERLEAVDRLIGLSRITMGVNSTNTPTIRAFLQMAAQGASMTYVESFGFLPKQGSVDCVRQVSEILKDGQVLASDSLFAEEPIVIAYQDTFKRFSSHSLALSDITSLCDILHAYLDDSPSGNSQRTSVNRTAELEGLAQAIEQVEALRNLVSIAVDLEPGLAEVVAGIRDGSTIRRDLLRSIHLYLREHGIASSTIALDSGILILRIEPGTIMSRLLDFGRSIELLITDDNLDEITNSQDIVELERRLRSSTDSIGLVVHSSRQVSEALFRHLDRLARQDHCYILPTGKTQLLSCLTSGRRLFEVVHEILLDTYKGIEPQRMVPMNLQPPPLEGLPWPYEREVLTTAWQSLITGHAGDCIHDLALLLDDLILLNCEFVLSYGQHRFGKEWMEDSAVPSEFRLSALAKEVGLDRGIRLLAAVRQLALRNGRYRDLSGMLPSDHDLALLNSARQRRNSIVHEHSPLSQTSALYSEMVDIARRLSPGARQWNLVALIGLPDGKILTVDPNGESEDLERLKIRSLDWMPTPNCIGFLVRAPDRADLVPLRRYCPNRRSELHDTLVCFPDRSQRSNCERCHTAIDDHPRIAAVRRHALAVRAEQNAPFIAACRQARTVEQVIAQLERMPRRAVQASDGSQAFASMRHDQTAEELVKRLRNLFNSRALEVQGPHDSGVDILIVTDNGRIGLQVKSFSDMADQHYLRSIQAQIQDSRRYDLAAYFLLLATSMPKHEPRVGRVFTTITTNRDSDYVSERRVFDPRTTWWLMTLDI